MHMQSSPFLYLLLLSKIDLFGYLMPKVFFLSNLSTKLPLIIPPAMINPKHIGRSCGRPSSQSTSNCLFGELELTRFRLKPTCKREFHILIRPALFAIQGKKQAHTCSLNAILRGLFGQQLARVSELMPLLLIQMKILSKSL